MAGEDFERALSLSYQEIYPKKSSPKDECRLLNMRTADSLKEQSTLRKYLNLKDSK